MLRGLKFPSRKLLTSFLALAVAAALSTACFKTLDESLLDDTSGGNAGGGSGGAGAGGNAGSGGSSGSAGTGAVGGQDAGSDASDAGMDADAAIPITVEAWDSSKYPSTDLAGGATNALISVDGNYVYWVQEDTTAQLASKHDLVGGSTT
ncbi:MAG: hypothetical protein KC492_33585, partial [Myxococcales bacterium]|nr:hypothetical protein [Myxococcales bacterium]